MSYPRVPKLKVPFEIEGSRAAVVEQDSTDEIRQCVAAILRTPLGSRLDEPEFGMPELTFREGLANRSDIEIALASWEPRAQYILREEDIDDITQEIDLYLQQEES